MVRDDEVRPEHRRHQVARSAGTVLAPPEIEDSARTPASHFPRSGPLVTAGGLVFFATGPDRQFRAYDRDNGKEVWSIELPAASEGMPATYEVNGRQFIVVPGRAGTGQFAARFGGPGAGAAGRRARQRRHAAPAAAPAAAPGDPPEQQAAARAGGQAPDGGGGRGGGGGRCRAVHGVRAAASRSPTAQSHGVSGIPRHARSSESTSKVAAWTQEHAMKREQESSTAVGDRHRRRRFAQAQQRGADRRPALPPGDWAQHQSRLWRDALLAADSDQRRQRREADSRPGRSRWAAAVRRCRSSSTA